MCIKSLNRNDSIKCRVIGNNKKSLQKLGYSVTLNQTA